MIETPITNIRAAKDFLHWLEDNGKMFHLEDDPSDIVDMNGLHIFTKDEASHIDKRLEELFSVERDPFGLLFEMGIL
jgi:hypothetical protein